MKVWNRIKEVREENNLSQSKLAEKIKSLNQSQICKIEKGNRSLKAEELKEIAYVLNVPISKLIS